MSILKASLLAASFALVAASSANAQTTRDYFIYDMPVSSATEVSMQARQAFASQKNRIKSGTERAPFSREANERFTW